MAAAAPWHLAGEAARLSRLLPARPQRPSPGQGAPRHPHRRLGRQERCSPPRNPIRAMQITTVGLDIAKNLFQVHGADAQGRVLLKRKLARGKVLEFFATLPACLVGLEACSAAHYWARELTRLGHQVRLMPPQYVRPYVKTNKHDAADAEACCEAVQRPGMRFVPAKSEDQQAMLVLHRVREQLLKQRTATVNAVRAHLAEFGIVAAQRRRGLRELLAVVADPEGRRRPPLY